MGNPSAFLLYGFLVTVAATWGLVAAAVLGAGSGREGGPHRKRRGGIVVLLVVWVAATGFLAASGLLTFGMPPTMPMVLVLGLAGVLILGFSETGGAMAAALPLWALVGFQAFRIPVEIMIHRAWVDGLAPVQMTWSGLNFDIVTGVTAVLLAAALLATRVPRGVVAAWNAMGVLLLVNVVAVAVLSMPTPFQVFRSDPPNVWVLQLPWVWLPAVLVMAAVLGHVLVARKLRP